MGIIPSTERKRERAVSLSSKSEVSSSETNQENDLVASTENDLVASTESANLSTNQPSPKRRVATHDHSPLSKHLPSGVPARQLGFHDSPVQDQGNPLPNHDQALGQAQVEAIPNQV